MPGVEIVTLVAKRRDAAYDALRELKRLSREGWIDLAGYALVEADENTELLIRETSAGLAGTLIGSLFSSAPDDMVDPIMAEPIEGVLQPGDSTLLAMAEPRYAERVAEEFETRGVTLRRQLERGQCERVLRASVEGIKSKVAWLEEFLDHESDKAGWVYGAEKERIESAIRAGRTELDGERGHLQARLLALRGELEAHLLEIAQGAEREGAGDAKGIGNAIEEIERDIADINEDLALCILDHLDGVATQAAELREQPARVSADEAAAIEIQLAELDVQLRKYRADLTATLASATALARRCMERLGGNAKRGASEMEAALRSHLRKLEQRRALLRADIQHLEKETSRTWNEVAPGFRREWRNLRESLDDATRNYQ